MGLFEGLDSLCSEQDKVLKAPFPYPGSKKRLVGSILPHLPLRSAYVEPFGGSGSVLLARPARGLEVYNDRFGGVSDFYKCLRDPKLLNRLIEQLSLTVCSKETFYEYKERWDKSNDPVLRASMWYYTMIYSFGGIGRNWGRAKGPVGVQAGVIQQHIPRFRELHMRLQRVQIENRDWFACCTDYDSPATVTYLDPPYLGTDCHVYKGGFGVSDHHAICGWAMQAEGFVALSAYDNEIYNAYDWDDVIEFDRTDIMISKNGNSQKDDIGAKCTTVTECLYIKE